MLGAKSHTGWPQWGRNVNISTLHCLAGLMEEITSVAFPSSFSLPKQCLSCPLYNSHHDGVQCSRCIPWFDPINCVLLWCAVLSFPVRCRVLSSLSYLHAPNYIKIQTIKRFFNVLRLSWEVRKFASLAFPILLIGLPSPSLLKVHTARGRRNDNVASYRYRTEQGR